VAIHLLLNRTRKMTSRIAYAILTWLNAQKDKLNDKDAAEGLEVGMQTIAEAFNVKLSDAGKEGISSSTLETWAKTGVSESKAPSGSIGSTTTSTGGSSAESSKQKPREGGTDGGEASEVEAEALKTDGNAALQAGMFLRAEELYTEAISLCSSGKNSHIYFSNRAAARQQLKNYEGALDDSCESVALNAAYAKGWSRKGTALQSLCRYKEALEAFEKCASLGLDASLPIAECKKALSLGASNSNSGMDGGDMGAGLGGMGGLSGLMGGLGGMPGGAGGNNPMAGLMASLGKDPEFLAAMADPEMRGIIQGAMSNPSSMLAHMGNPKVRNFLLALANRAPTVHPTLMLTSSAAFPFFLFPPFLVTGDETHGKTYGKFGGWGRKQNVKKIKFHTAREKA